ncbi:acyltransferase family protein [Dinoroseobacter sp. S76]|uniref:acyltransferase family protein n=1 Tax=Dinoroseobacter sp. S76 TaxID=3415124 RepID=UPI003C7BADBF
MSPGFSLWLDTLRAGAALTVLFGHMAHIRFTRGDYHVLREWNVASDAVVVFFVLSGVVIAAAAERDGGLGRFAFKRLTRIYGVLIPALLLTLLFDALGQRVDPTAYQAPFYAPVSVGEMVLRGGTMTNEWQGIWTRLRLGSNGPLWSLSYEVAFYALFAVFVFLRGALRWVLMLLLLLLAGLPILALLPCWLLGVLLWSRLSRRAPPSRGISWAVALGAPLLALALKASGLPDDLTERTADWFAPWNHHLILGYSDEALWSFLLASCVALHLWGVHGICAARAPSPPSSMAKLTRWIAGGSFSLYVMHYPSLHLLDATLPNDLPGHDLWMLGLTLAICFAFAQIFERPLIRQRRALEEIWSRLKRPGATLLKDTKP